MSTHTLRLPVLLVIVVLATLTAGCDDDATAPVSTTSSSPSVAASTEPSGEALTRAGLTVHLPLGCSATAIAADSCSGLSKVKVSAVGPLDDLIAPGVHRQDDGWIGLRVVGEAYVFAASSDRPALVELLDSATMA